MKHSITGDIQLADDYSINIDKLFEEALKEVYGEALVEESKKTLSTSLFKVTNEPLQHAVDSVFAAPEFGKSEQGFLDQFKYNTGVFAAFKAHAEQKLLVSMLLDEEGNLRSFREFRKTVKAVNIQWNEQWLRTEYNTAVRSARSAANYQDALRSKDTYPNLEYLVSNARDKREEHLELVGTILPIEHPFWDIFLPPWDWNCQCSFRPTDKPATDVPKITQIVPPTFQNNPGKTAEFVKLNEHPYLKGKGVATCPECRRQGLVSSGSGDELCQMHQKAREEARQESKQKLLEWRESIPKGIGLNVPTSLPYLPSLHISKSSVKTTLSKYSSKPWLRDAALMNITDTINKAEYIGWAYDELLPSGEQKHPGVSGWLYYKTPVGIMNVRVFIKDGKRAYYCFEEQENPTMQKGKPKFL